MNPTIKCIACNPFNYSQSKCTPKYIVVHYTGNKGDTAKSNATYFHTAVTKTSAHYFVDENEIYQSVPDFYTAYSVGCKTGYYHKYARNNNTINIEMCDSFTTIPAKTKQNTFYLIKLIMDRYSIPVENVIRHYDVTHKLCPKPLISEIAWNNFKKELKNYISGGENTMKKITVEEAKQILKNTAKISDATIEWLSYYKYADTLFIKLAEAMKK